MFEGGSPPDWEPIDRAVRARAELLGMSFREVVAEFAAAPANYVLTCELPWRTWLWPLRRLRLQKLRAQLHQLPYDTRSDADPRVIEADTLISDWEFGHSRLTHTQRKQVRRRAILHMLDPSLITQAFHSRHVKASGCDLRFKRLSDEAEAIWTLFCLSQIGVFVWCYLMLIPKALVAGCLSCEEILQLQIANLAATVAFIAYKEGPCRRTKEKLLLTLGCQST